jgi:hypothetical protein
MEEISFGGIRHRAACVSAFRVFSVFRGSQLFAPFAPFAPFA